MSSVIGIIHMPEHSIMSVSLEQQQQQHHLDLVEQQHAIEEYYRTRHVPKMNPIEKLLDHTSYERVKLRVQYRLPWLVGPPPNLIHATTQAVPYNKTSSSSKCKVSFKDVVSVTNKEGNNNSSSGNGGGWFNNNKQKRNSGRVRNRQRPGSNNNNKSKIATRYIRDVDSDTSGESCRSGWTETTGNTGSSSVRTFRRPSLNLGIDEGLAELPSIDESEYHSLGHVSQEGSLDSTNGCFLSSAKLQKLAKSLEKEEQENKFTKGCVGYTSSNNNMLMIDTSLSSGCCMFTTTATTTTETSNQNHYYYKISQKRVKDYVQQQNEIQFNNDSSSRSLNLLLQDDVINSNPLSIRMLPL